MKEFFTQLLALVAFFAFPAFQYIVLRQFSKREGAPQLWFLPRYQCFRLVIRNIPGKRTLSELKTRAVLRAIVPATEGATVASFMDEVLPTGEDFFLFPGNDHTLISFRLERTSSNSIDFILADKLGVEKKRFSLNTFQRLICDYTANIENLLNFDIKMGKRAEVSSESLGKIFAEIDARPIERSFPIDRIRDVH